MHCKNCGKEIEKDSNFCKYCGKNVDRKTNNTPIIILSIIIVIIIVFIFSVILGKTMAIIIDGEKRDTAELDKNYEDDYFNNWNYYNNRHNDNYNNEDRYGNNHHYYYDNNRYSDYTKYFENIDIQRFLELKSKEEVSIIYIGKDNCTSCYQQSVYLYSIARRYNLKINYLNISNLTEEDYQKLMNSDEYFKRDWTAPLIILVKNNQIIEDEDDVKNTNELLDLFDENGLIND